MSRALRRMYVLFPALAAAGCGHDPVRPTSAGSTIPIEQPAGTVELRDARVKHDARYTVHVPTRLRIESADGRLVVSIDLTTLERAKLDRDPAPEKVHGVKAIWPGGIGLKGPCESFDADCFDVGGWLLESAQHPSGAAIEVRLILFETDLFPGHMWRPEAGAYHELWTATLSGRAP
jgi:hypothetical protein